MTDEIDKKIEEIEISNFLRDPLTGKIYHDVDEEKQWLIDKLKASRLEKSIVLVDEEAVCRTKEACVKAITAWADANDRGAIAIYLDEAIQAIRKCKVGDARGELEDRRNKKDQPWEDHDQYDHNGMPRV